MPYPILFDHDAIRRAYAEPGATRNTVAALFGCAPKTVDRIVGARRRTFDKAAIRAHYAAGASLRETGAVFGCSARTVQRIVGDEVRYMGEGQRLRWEARPPAPHCVEHLRAIGVIGRAVAAAKPRPVKVKPPRATGRRLLIPGGHKNPIYRKFRYLGYPKHEAIAAALDEEMARASRRNPAGAALADPRPGRSGSLPHSDREGRSDHGGAVA